MWVGTIGGITILRIQRETVLVWLFSIVPGLSNRVAISFPGAHNIFYEAQFTLHSDPFPDRVLFRFNLPLILAPILCNLYDYRRTIYLSHHIKRNCTLDSRCMRPGIKDQR